MTTCHTAAGRVALVTGANKGIGYFIALQLGLSGLFQHVLLACRDAGRAAVAVESIQAKLVLNQQQFTTISAVPLILGDHDSHQALAKTLQDQNGKIDVLVNNAAFAFKGADPTPFEEQTKPTLDVNFRATVDLTERLLPLLRKGSSPRLVNVASRAGRLQQLSAARQAQFSAPDLTMPQLFQLMDEFEQAVVTTENNSGGPERARALGFGTSNYGMSKLAVVAATRIWARENNGIISVNCCCPGYCQTDMTSQRGTRPPEEGARNAVLPATLPEPPTGAFFRDYQEAGW